MKVTQVVLWECYTLEEEACQTFLNKSSSEILGKLWGGGLSTGDSLSVLESEGDAAETEIVLLTLLERVTWAL